MAETKAVRSFPHDVQERENVWITLADGCRLAARIWLPADPQTAPVPAVLEYLPYRKRDGTAQRDALTYPYFAGHGYAGVRVDIRGNGESDGLMLDEYLSQEQDDALEVIAWIAAQPWCDGNVGMMGISWGGFNALQVAARRPPALKAIITLCSTDDRYADDIHYKGGALLMENLGWASTMLAFSSRPPDPLLVGDRWREMWLERLENMPLLIETWLQHPHRDAYWKHGSVCEDFSGITTPVLAVGGWGDAYSNAIARMVKGLTSPVRAIIGPWVHKYPHFAAPEPAIGFLQEAVRWWDHWLKGLDTEVMDDPVYRVYSMDGARPRASYQRRAGHWFAASQWPPAETGELVYGLGDGCLRAGASDDRQLSQRSPQDTGTGGGEYCAMWLGPEGPTDQRRDDAGSLTFDSEPLTSALSIAGAPALELDVAVDRPQANIAVRLCDVWPEGGSARITYGVFNLCHRDGSARPSLLEPGRRYCVRVQLDDIAYGVAPGHRLRLSISTAYWPMIWPSPEPVNLTVFTAGSMLRLHRLEAPKALIRPFPAPESAAPLETETLRAPFHSRTIGHDVGSAETVVRITDDFGAERNVEHGLEAGEVASEMHVIARDDPSTCRSTVDWTETLGRGQWQVRTESRTVMWSDASSFFVEAELEAFEAEERVFTRKWSSTIPRNKV